MRIQELAVRHGITLDPERLKKARALMRNMGRRKPSPCCGEMVIKPKTAKPFCSQCFKDVKR